MDLPATRPPGARPLPRPLLSLAALCSVILGLALLQSLVPPAEAATTVRCVTTGLSCPNCPGTCHTAGIQAAVDAAVDGDILAIAGGTYTGIRQRLGYSQTAFITKTLRLVGGFNPADFTDWAPAKHVTVLDAGGKGRLLVVSGTVTARLEYLTLAMGQAGSGGKADGGAVLGLYAAAIHIANSRVISSGTGSGGSGGGVAAPTIYLTDTEVSGNGAFGSGGGARSFNYLSVSGGLFGGNVAIDSGGALYADELAVNGGVFRDNWAVNGDGGAVRAVRLTVSGAQFTGNTDAVFGGAMYAENEAAVSGSMVVSSVATLGGGLSARSATISGGSFEGNSAEGQGGGILALDGVTITNAHFQGNNAVAFGGAIYADSVQMTATRLIDNTAAQGGGLYIYGGGPDSRIANSLLARNHTAGRGQAIRAFPVSGPGGRLDAVHTTIASGPGDDPAVAINSGATNITSSIIAGFTTGIDNGGGEPGGEGALNEDHNLFAGNTIDITGTVSSGGHSVGSYYLPEPGFAGPAADDYHLTAASHAIDLGATPGPTTDLDGAPRPQGGRPDAGAYESAFTALADVMVWKLASPAVVSAGSWLTYTLLYNNQGSHPALNVAITDVVPACLTGLWYATDWLTPTLAVGQAYAWQIGVLPAMKGGDIHVHAQVGPTCPSGLLRNTVAITAETPSATPGYKTSYADIVVPWRAFLPLVTRPLP